MISFPALFFALSSVALIAALAAIWNSLRVALGGGAGLVIETARDLPDHAALVEEKNSLLRAIKDLEYEHAVGKISDADHQRLDAAYRARAKQVIGQLDRDVKPLYDEARRLIAARAAATEPRPSARTVDRSERDAHEAAPSASAAPATRETSSLDEMVEAIRSGDIAGMPDLSELPPEKREKVEALLRGMVEKYVVDRARREGDERAGGDDREERDARDEEKSE